MFNYYPFGMVMPGRSFAAQTPYRYGFNGKEKLDEVYGGGNAYDYGERIYDPRLGRLLSIDPLIDKYPELSSYQYANNSPIANIDLLGEQDLYYAVKFNEQGKSILYLALTDKSWLNKLGIGGSPSYYLSYKGNYFYQTDEVSWLNPGMGMKMLSKYEGKTEAELDAMTSTLTNTVDAYHEQNKKIADDVGNLFSDAISGASIVKYAQSRTVTTANNKVSTDGKKKSTNNSGTQNAGGKNNQTNPQKAGAVTGTGTAGANAKPVVKSTKIGLGLDAELSRHRGSGAITYKDGGWQQAGLTKVDWGRASMSDTYFMDSFKEAAKNATSIKFNVTNFNPFHSKPGITNKEFNHIVSDPSLLKKTEFIRDGKTVTWDGKIFNEK